MKTDTIHAYKHMINKIICWLLITIPVNVIIIANFMGSLVDIFFPSWDLKF